MKKLYTLLGAFFLSITICPLYSQIPSFDWAIQLQSSSVFGLIDQSKMTLDHLGNVYVVGKVTMYTTGSPSTSIDFSSGTGSGSLVIPDGRTYIAKYDSDMNFIWAKTNYTGYFEVNDVDISPENELIISGEFQGDTDFDLGADEYIVPSDNQRDAYIAKYNENGDLIWVDYTEGDLATVTSKEIEVDNLGNIYQIGTFGGTTDFDSGVNENILVANDQFPEDRYVRKIDSNGNLVWVKQLPTDSPNYFDTYDMTISPSGDAIYFIGRMKGPFDFNPDPDQSDILDAADQDCFLTKWDTDGNYVWAKAFSSTSFVFLRDIEVQPNGNLALLGTFKDNLEYDPSGQSISEVGITGNNQFIMQIDGSGGFIRVNSFSVSGNNTALNINQLALDSAGDIYVEASLKGMLDFDLSDSTAVASSYKTGSFYNSSIFYAKYDADLNYLWHTRLTENESDDNLSIGEMKIDGDNNILSTGRFSNILDFPYYTLTQGGYHSDAIILKFKQCDYITTNNAFSCGAYTWGESTYESTGTYSQTFPSVLGCDSLVELNLTVYPLDTAQTDVSGCHTYFWDATGEEYDEPGSYSAVLESINGCDSVATIHLTLQNQTSVVEAANCASYYWEETQITYENSGTYEVTYENIAGCDSTIYLELEIFEPDSSVQEESICESYFWSATGQTYSESGTYSAVLSTEHGCDSTVTLTLTILEPSTGIETVETCESYLWQNTGQIYTETGSYESTLTNAAGCDSIVNLNLTILEDSISENISTCDSYTWPVNGNTYSSSGTYSESYTNTFGCDSIRNLNLEVTQVDTSVVQNGIELTAQANLATFQWLDCNNGFSPIEGATENVFIPTENGSYAVIVIQDGCQDTSACHSITSVGLVKVDPNSIGLSVYPNPTTGIVHINYNSTSYNTLSISCFDMLGKLVYTGDIDISDSFQIPGTFGIYQVQVVIDERYSSVFKVVKLK